MINTFRISRRPRLCQGLARHRCPLSQEGLPFRSFWIFARDSQATLFAFLVEPEAICIRKIRSHKHNSTRTRALGLQRPSVQNRSSFPEKRCEWTQQYFRRITPSTEGTFFFFFKERFALKGHPVATDNLLRRSWMNKDFLRIKACFSHHRGFLF